PQISTPSLHDALPIYHTLIDPQERAFHDQQLDKGTQAAASILHSANPHAQRARDMQARWDQVVNQILETDRRENIARQRAVFTRSEEHTSELQSPCNL